MFFEQLWLILLILERMCPLSTTLVLEVKASTCSTITENLLLYCLKFAAFAVVVKI